MVGAPLVRLDLSPCLTKAFVKPFAPVGARGATRERHTETRRRRKGRRRGRDDDDDFVGDGDDLRW